MLPEFDGENPQTFFDIEIGTPGAEGNQKGRVVMEMFTRIPHLTIVHGPSYNLI